MIKYDAKIIKKNYKNDEKLWKKMKKTMKKRRVIA